MYYVGLFYAYTLQEKVAFGVEAVLDAVLLSITTRQSAVAFKV